ncbi:hypothetical protein FSPOR_1201 [Fusarium sporotrichioides]|uniref:Copper-fist domain-containing protein n=1 Tax=Fusarium sporotrichioides TaxID=5514 RepID=A0A395SQ85_FUSSP|nr:hypothetical protein FSPOR_1201 [Fusarium sporotrichioides]
MSVQNRSRSSSTSSADWTGRMHGQHKVCCERCYDGHRARSECKPDHAGTLVVLGKGSGRPAGARKGTVGVPALILQDGTFLPAMRMKVVERRPRDKVLRDRRVALHYREVAQMQLIQGQGVGMQPIGQVDGFPNENPNMLLNQTQGFQQQGPVSMGMDNPLGHAMQMPANAMGDNMTYHLPGLNQQILATVDQSVPKVAPAPTVGPDFLPAQGANFVNNDEFGGSDLNIPPEADLGFLGFTQVHQIVVPDMSWGGVSNIGVGFTHDVDYGFFGYQ